MGTKALLKSPKFVSICISWLMSDALEKPFTRQLMFISIIDIKLSQKKCTDFSINRSLWKKENDQVAKIQIEIMCAQIAKILIKCSSWKKIKIKHTKSKKRSHWGYFHHAFFFSCYKAKEEEKQNRKKGKKRLKSHEQSSISVIPQQRTEIIRRWRVERKAGIWTSSKLCEIIYALVPFA